MMKKHLLFILSLFIVPGIMAQTTVKKENGAWQLYVDGAPFDVKGVTIGGKTTKKETISATFKDLQFLGVNSIRTWGTDEDTRMLLDTAQAYGIKVMVGIWMRHGRPGMEGDDNFNYLEDKQGMEDMYNYALKTVRDYKDHPAVLCFGVGNEVVLNIATDAEKKAYAQYLEKVCSAIKAEDPAHPVASVSAWTFSWEWWRDYTPSIDIYAINVYGAGADRIPDEMANLKIDKPYVITEFGVRGEWEVPKDDNGLEIEPDDREKYDVIAEGYPKWIKPKPACLGVYVFHYSHSTTHGSVWLTLYYDDAYRPQYWATREAFTGKKPVNHVPDITQYALPDAPAATGAWVPVTLEVTDKEGDDLQISFHYNQRSGGRARADQINPLEYRGSLEEGFEVLLPRENGVIKVYAFVRDSYNNLGIAQRSFMIDNGKNTEKLIPGARAELPFYVYEDGDDLPYIPTGYMGDFQHLKVDGKHKRERRSGGASLKITYDHTGGWYGLAFVDPPDDWGDRPGGFNLTGATKLTFWAKSTSDKVVATFGYGMIGENKPYYDTDKRSSKEALTKEWKQYSVNIPKNADLRCIKTGFTIYGGGIGEPYSIWIDDVRFE